MLDDIADMSATDNVSNSSSPSKKTTNTKARAETMKSVASVNQQKFLDLIEASKNMMNELKGFEDKSIQEI